MARKLIATIRINLAGGDASPVELGKMLGPKGVALMDVKKQFDAATAQHRGHVVPADVAVYEDRTFTLSVRTPTTASLLKRAAGLDAGAAKPNGAPVAWITLDQLREVARVKLPDLNADDLAAAERIVAGTARSMGIGVRG